MESEVKDLYNSKQLFDNWVKAVEKEGIKGLNSKHSNLILKIIKDFSIGLNTSKSSVKGARSHIRLNHLQQKLSFILRNLEERGIKDITKLQEKEIHKLFNDMRTGIIKKTKKTKGSEIYKSTGDYVKEFKVFWHWLQKVAKKEGKIIEDITEDLDERGEKPKFIYFCKEDFDKIISKASYDLKPILALIFDSGCRVTELLNIKVSDFEDDFKKVNIREETSKTFGRKIKLMLCSEQIKEYIKKLNLKPNDFINQKISYPMINKELKNLGKDVLKEEQIKFKNLNLYDFRHSSACYWLPIYKSESALKYRFGWKKSEMIHYYTEFLGMKDTICEDDMYVDITKTELEKKIKNLELENKELSNSVCDIKDNISELLYLKALLTFPKVKKEIEKHMKSHTKIGLEKYQKGKIEEPRIIKQETRELEDTGIIIK